jgi:Plasmid pRiA4b ORF-3-like protein
MAAIARLRIDLDEVTPRVRRRVEVPLDIRLDELHRVIQAAMGWEDYHLYEFRRAGTAWGVPDPTWDFPGTSALPAADASLADLLGDRAKRFTYVYDFGDDWRHTVRVEAVAEAAPGVRYPRFLDGEGRCPPEDVGGPWGYADFLEAVADPGHERHDELLQWCGGTFDPTDIGEAAIREGFARLATRLARKGARRPGSEVSGGPRTARGGPRR